MQTAPAIPQKSQSVGITTLTAADACAPRCPTIAASMYSIRMVEISANTAGTESLMTSDVCS